MSKLVFNLKEIESKKSEYIALDQWHERLLKDTKEIPETTVFKYLNNYEFSVEKEKIMVDEVDRVYENILEELSLQLNKLHKVNWGLKAWRIFVGPWVNRFIAIIYDRTSLVLPLINKDNIQCNAQIEKGMYEGLASNSMRDFTDKTLKKNWNDKLFNRIIYLLKTNNFSNEKNYENCEKLIFENYKTQIEYCLNFLIFFFIKIIFFPVNLFNNYVVYKPYFGNLSNLIKFILKLKDIPLKYSFGFFDDFIVKKNFNINIRNKININKDCKDKREKIARFLINECMPTIYLEGFQKLMSISKYSFLPNKKKIILTCNAWRDNIFKFWLATQSNKNAKIIYGQHGAGYGTNLKHYAEIHELKICDKYLSWGWKKDNNKILPIGDFSSLKKKEFNYISNKKILIIAGNINTFKFNNIIHNKNEAIFKEDQLKSFFDNLDKKIENIYFKDHPNDVRRDISLSKILKKNKVHLKVINEGKNFDHILNKYELLIYPYQFATPFLKYLLLNKPSLSLFEIDYIEDKVKNDFEPLFKSNILHSSMKNMALFLNKNYHNIRSWWESSETQKARILFCQKYIKNKINFDFLIEELKKEQKILYK